MLLKACKLTPAPEIPDYFFEYIFVPRYFLEDNSFLQKTLYPIFRKPVNIFYLFTKNKEHSCVQLFFPELSEN